MLQSTRRQLVSALLGVVVCGFVGLPVAAAEDLEIAYRDLVAGADFRVRLAAALTIGKSADTAARAALEKALDDPHPAVRAGAAAGLGAVGDPAAITALSAAAAREPTASVRSQIETTIARLSSTARSVGGKTRFRILVGRIDNRSSVTSPALSATLKSATRSRLLQVPGVELLAEGADARGVSKDRGKPLLVLDGSLMVLTRSTRGSEISYAARVEYMIRRAFDQSLKGTMTGRAQALADARSVHAPNAIVQLQLDAVAAAIESALRGAPPALEAAAMS